MQDVVDRDQVTGPRQTPALRISLRVNAIGSKLNSNLVVGLCLSTTSLPPSSTHILTPSCPGCTGRSLKVSRLSLTRFLAYSPRPPNSIIDNTVPLHFSLGPN